MLLFLLPHHIVYINNISPRLWPGVTSIAGLGSVDNPLRPEEILAVAHDGVAGPQAGSGPLAVERGGDATLDLDTGERM